MSFDCIVSKSLEENIFSSEFENDQGFDLRLCRLLNRLDKASVTSVLSLDLGIFNNMTCGPLFRMQSGDIKVQTSVEVLCY